MERRKSQIKAERAYEAKRPKRPVGIRLDDDEMAQLDRLRGKMSRSAYLLHALRETMKSGKIPSKH